jgi:hypothetical protein
MVSFGHNHFARRVIMQYASNVSTLPTAFAVLLAPEAMETSDFEGLHEWLEERRDQVEIMVAAHERLPEVFGQFVE